MYLPDEHHERLWRICDVLVTSAGARGAMICEANGAIVLTVGDLSTQGTPQGVELLGPGERLVRGEGGNVYGVEMPGGVLLAVLHPPSVFEQVRKAAAEAVRQAIELFKTVPPPPPPPPMPGHEDEHQHEPPRKSTSSKKKKGRTKPARPSAKKKAKKKKPSRPPRRPARRRSTRT